MVGPFTPMMPTTIPMAGLYAPSLGLRQGMRSAGPWMRPSRPWMGHPGPRMELEPWSVPHGSSLGYPGQPMGYPGPGIGIGHPGPRMELGPWNVPHGSSLGYPGPGIGMGHPGPYAGHNRRNTGFLMSGSGMRSRGMSPPPPQVKKKKQPEVTEEKKPELKGEQKPESEGEQKPESKEEQKPESEGEQKPGSNEEQKPESEGEQKPESKGEQKPESKGEQKPESKGEQKLESEGEQKPESEGEQKQATKSRPVASTPIPGTVWCVVRTNDGRHFFYDPSKRRSVWKMPEELKNNPDVDKLLPPKPEVKAVKREEKDVQEEPPAKKFKSEAEVKETKEECAKEGAQEAVLKQETANTIQVHAAAIPLEERVKQFKELLAEKNVLVPSKWEWELAKVAYDKRYLLLTSEKRRHVYYEFMRERAEEMDKDIIQRASEAKKLYRELLEESNLKMKSTFRDFTINHSSDSRFRMITSLRDRHSMFLDYMAENEKEQSVREKLQKDFMNMLRETHFINRGSKWKFLRGTLSSDPRFKAVAVTHRASWFQLYLTSENFEKKDFLEMLSEIPGINESTSWSDLQNKVNSDPRYKAVVGDSDRENWFGKHLKIVKKKKKHFLKMLIEIPGIDDSTSWIDLRNKVSSDSRYKAVVRYSDREDLIKTYLKSIKDKKNDFLKMLSEIPGINDSTSWSDVEKKASSDSRYKAVVSDSDREDWFGTYLKIAKKEKKDFLEMLSEIPGINESTRWSDVQNKVNLDPRYKAVVSDSDRENWFGKHLKIVKKKKKDFLKMLFEIPGIDDSTSWIDLRNKVSSDSRYKAVVRYSDREDLIKTYLKSIKDKKNDFLKMLSEIPGINDSTSWSDVEKKASSDSRYKAVVSDSDRENWFGTYLKTVTEATSDDVRNKTEQSKSVPLSSVKETDESEKSNREAATENFNQFLVEKLKKDFMNMLRETHFINRGSKWKFLKGTLSSDPRFKAVAVTHRASWFQLYLTSENFEKKDFLEMLSEIPGINESTSWSDVQNKVNSDPRYKAVVSHSDREHWFGKHLKIVKKKKKHFLKMLIEIPGIDDSTSWIDLRNKVSSDSRYKAVVRYSDREDLIKTYLKSIKDKKNDFLKMLSEIPGINDSTSWSDVEKKASSDSRYKAVVSDSDREDWFGTYLKIAKKEKKDFLEMLSEIPGINESTRWSDVQNKVNLDPRYKAVVSDSDRENWFGKHLKIVKKKKKDFLKMLFEIPGIDDSTSWIDLRNKVSSDSRYKAVVRYSDREDLIKTYLKSIKDKKNDFLKMLSEIPGINDSTSWSDVEKKASSDSRYKAVVSDSDRENWFGTYLKTVTEATSDDVRNKTEQSKSVPLSSVKETDESEKSNREAATENFNQFLVEKLKKDFMNMLRETHFINRGSKWKFLKGTLSSDPRFKAVAVTHRASWFQLYLTSENFEKKDFLEMLSEIPGINESTSWSDVQNKVNSDPRYKAVVSHSDREHWFGKHLKIVKKKKKDFLKMLFEIPGIDDSTSWIDLRNKVSSDSRYKAVVRYSDREDLIKTYLKSIKDKKNDFLKMLSEIPGINDSTSWSDVEKKVSSDPRYKAVVSDSDREDWFGTYLKTVKEKKDDFLKMLSEIPSINDSTSWIDVRKKVSSDPRYKAVVRYSRKDYFRTYLKTIKDATSDDIRNKTEQSKSLPLSSVMETDESEKSNREAATEDFKQFIVEKVRHSEGSFESFKSRFDRNPRWTVELTDAEKKILYDSHVGERNKQILHKSEVKENFKKMLSVIPGINSSSSWREVKIKVSSEPHYKAVASDSRRVDWFRAFVKTLKDVPYDDIRNKKQQIKSFHSSSLNEKDDSSKSHKEAAEDFVKFLAEKVTNCEGSFESFKSRFDSDPRWAEELTDADKKKLYDSQVEEIQKQNLEILWSVLDEIENERSAGTGKNFL